MKFLVDNQIPISLARWIADQGFDVVHARTQGWAEKPDGYLWQLGIRKNRIVISKDVDFFHLCSREGDVGRLLWWRRGNCSTKEMISIFEVEWPVIPDPATLSRLGRELQITPQADGSVQVRLRTPNTSDQQIYTFAQKPCWQLQSVDDQSI